jgi:hypothetical protein
MVVIFEEGRRGPEANNDVQPARHSTLSSDSSQTQNPPHRMKRSTGTHRSRRRQRGGRAAGVVIEDHVVAVDVENFVVMSDRVSSTGCADQMQDPVKCGRRSLAAGKG